MILNGSQRRLLRESILEAYPDVSELQILLDESMDINLSTWSSGNSYNSIVFNLIQKLQAKGKLEKFIQSLLDDKPNSPYLKDIRGLMSPSSDSFIENKITVKILIVEDDLISSRSLGDILEKLGHIVVKKVTNGHDALSEFNKLQPDLVLMDIKIQGDKDGLDVSKEIRSIVQIPIIYVTAFGDDPKIQERLVQLDPNYCGLLNKPYNEEDIKSNINLALTKYLAIKSDSDLPAYNLSEQTWYTKPIPILKEFTAQDRDSLKDKINVVVITATDVELRSVLRLLKPLPRKRKVRLLYEGPETYYIGKFGAFGTVVTKCRMGATGENSVILATQQALSFWQPKVIIMIGIAFGKDAQKQKIADVLVATQIIPYELQKVGERIEYRAPVPPSNATLLNRFENVLNWQFNRPDDLPCTIHKGPILSGEKLINDPEFKARLFQVFPTAIGGEIEGSGLCAAAGRIGQPWILVKSICDWADGNKGDKHQALAAASATDLVHHVLSQTSILDGL
jgi:nucleoside phosphorylase/DNA-binding response OmpR family regulator